MNPNTHDKAFELIRSKCDNLQLLIRNNREDVAKFDYLSSLIFDFMSFLADMVYIGVIDAKQSMHYFDVLRDELFI